MKRHALMNPAFLAAMLMLGAGAGGIGTAITTLHVVLHKKPVYAEDNRAVRAIPTETERWIQYGKDQEESADVVEELGTENYLTRTYVEKSPAPGAKPRALQLHVAYYTGMIDTVPHVPDRCFVGAGYSLVGGPWTTPVPLSGANWLPAEDLPASLKGRVYTTRLSHEFSTAGPGRRVNLPIDLGPNQPLSIRVTSFSAPNGTSRTEGYFFIANGVAVDSAEKVRFKAFDLSTEYAYYLKVQVGTGGTGTPEELAADAADLLNDLLGEIMTCVPDWVRVEQGSWPPDNPRGTKPAGPEGRR